VKSEKLKIE